MIEFESVYPAEPGALWKAWTTPEALQSWLTAKAVVEPEVGGAFELFWQPETPDRNSTVGCKITEIEPERRLSFEWRGPPEHADLMNVEPFPTRVTVELYALPTGTRMRFRHLGWGEGAEWAAARKWQENAWLGAFAQLDDYVRRSVRRDRHIDFIELPVTDLAAAKAFYGEVFGWTFTDYGPAYADIVGAGLNGGLLSVDTAPPRGGTLVVLYARDLEATLARVRSAGGEIVKEIFSFPGGRRFHFLDPSGNELAIWSDD